MMSDMIITRNANQCRSHHQKMIKYRRTIFDIINSVAEKYQPTLFARLTQKYLVFIKNLLLNQTKYVRVFGEGEKVRYVETYIDFSNNCPKGAVKLQPQEQKEVGLKSAQLDKGEDRRKTNDQYLPNADDMDSEQNGDDIPIIGLPDPKLQAQQHYDPLPVCLPNTQTVGKQLGI